MEHAFKGTRFPWTKERMEFILNELITKQKKYKVYTKLIEVYIILAEKIGATPRIVENFIKNLGRDYREWMKMHPNCDRDVVKLRGSNKIFKLFEEYNRIYLHEDPPNFPQPKLTEYTLDEQDRLVQIPEVEDEDDDSHQYLEVIEAGVKEEQEDQASQSLKITSVMSMSSQATSSSIDDEPPSPTPPPPPLPRVPKPQGRRSIGSIQAQASSQASALRHQEPVGLQDVTSIPTEMSQAAQLKHVAPGSSSTSNTMHGHAKSPIPPNILSSVANQALLSTISSMPSLQQPTFHLSQGSTSSQGPGSQYIPLHVIQNGSVPPASFTAHSSVASEEMLNSIPGTSKKRPMKAQHDAQQHFSKKSRTSSVPLVAESLPDGMTEFERRYLQSMDTQNKMLSDIGRELKLLRTGFFAIHSDEIADMVNPNMH